MRFSLLWHTQAHNMYSFSSCMFLLHAPLESLPIEGTIGSFVRECATEHMYFSGQFIPATVVLPRQQDIAFNTLLYMQMQNVSSFYCIQSCIDTTIVMILLSLLNWLLQDKDPACL